MAFCSDETSNLLESDLDLDLPKFRSIVASDASRDGKEFDPEQSISSSSRRDSDLFVIEGTLSGKNEVLIITITLFFHRIIYIYLLFGLGSV